MLFKDRYWSTPGDAAWRRREESRKRREYTLQALLLLMLVALVAAIALNVSENLEAKHIRSGFDFLSSAAGFDVGEKAFAFSSTDALWKAFVLGLINTIRVSICAIVSATVLGVVVGVMQLSRHPVLRFLGAAHVEAYRNIPLLVLLLAIYLVVTELLPGVREAWSLGSAAYLSKTGLLFAVPAWGHAFWASLAAAAASAVVVARLAMRRFTWVGAALSGLAVFVVVGAVVWAGCGFAFGWDAPVKTRFSMRGGAALSPEFLALWLGLTLFTSASIAEIVRAGVLAVRPGQWNAGAALGLTRSQTLSYVVLPQSLRLAVPPMASQYMNLTKNSSLAVMVGYPDVVNVGNTAINVTAQALEVIALIMAVYLVVNLVISILMNGLNALVMRAPQ